MIFVKYLHCLTVYGAITILWGGPGAQAKDRDGQTDDLMTYAQVQQVNHNQGEHSASFSGNVSWYGPHFHGKKTASGEIFDMYKQTAAHLTLPFGTKVLVEDPRTGKTAIVKVNDRGPYAHGRVMDLSREGARRLGTLTDGVAFVDCLVINPSD